MMETKDLCGGISLRTVGDLYHLKLDFDKCNKLYSALAGTTDNVSIVKLWQN